MTTGIATFMIIEDNNDGWEGFVFQSNKILIPLVDLIKDSEVREANYWIPY